MMLVSLAGLCSTAAKIVRGVVERDLLATDDADNEENAVQLGEQMIREAFRKWREKKASTT